MSLQKRKLKILPDAKKHIRDILKFTQQRWGSDQRISYKKRLYDAFNLILDTPLIGKKRNEIRQGYVSFHVERHYIFYKIYNDRIEIVAIVHDSMDVKAFFNA